MSVPLPRLATRRVDGRSIGFLLAGASTIAARHMVAAIRGQPPVPGSQDVAGAWVVGIHSHNERRGREFAGRHAIAHAGTDLEHLLNRPEVQVVYVSNLPRRHAETVRMALLAQKHVLCEPPLALTRAEAAELAQMAAHRGLLLGMNYAWRAAPVTHRIHTLLQEDAIGEVLGGRIHNTAFLPATQQTWRLQQSGGGVLLDRTLHDVDLIQSLLHTSVREVFVAATHRVAPGGVAEEVVGYLKLAGGAIVQFFDSFLQPQAPVLLELFGTTWSLRGEHCAPASAYPSLHLHRAGETAQVTVETIDPYRAVVGRLLAALRGAAPLLATAADEVRNLAVVAALDLALDCGKASTVEQHS